MQINALAIHAILPAIDSLTDFAFVPMVVRTGIVILVLTTTWLIGMATWRQQARFLSDIQRLSSLPMSVFDPEIRMLAVRLPSSRR
jgi:K+ transporter